MSSLFQPFACKSLRLDNRVAMASTARWSAPGGDPKPLAAYYRRRIEGGAALIMTEGAAIDRPAAYNDPKGPHLFGPALDGWRAVVAEIHAAGGKIIPQLWHCGAVGKAASDWSPPADPESPSGLVAVGRALVADPNWTRKVREGRMDELASCTQADLAPSVAN